MLVTSARAFCRPCRRGRVGARSLRGRHPELEQAGATRQTRLTPIPGVPTVAQCPFKPLLDFEKFASGTPHALIGELRSAHRILWEDDEFATGGHWLVFQQRDIDQVLQSPALFSSNYGPLLDDFPEQLLAEQQESVTFMDPPRHRQYRSLVEGAFRQTAMRQREPMMRALATSILDEVLPRGECEFVQ